LAITPLSGSPSQLTVTTMGKESASATIRNSHEARNLPTIACQPATGIVSNSSIVPSRRSSDHRRIPAAGTRNRNSHGSQLKNAASEASPRSKKPPKAKVKNPESKRKIKRNTYATGDSKYDASSRFATVPISDQGFLKPPRPG